MNDRRDENLRSALKLLGEETAQVDISSSVESRLLGAVRRRRVMSWKWTAWAAAAALFIGAIGLGLQFRRPSAEHNSTVIVERIPGAAPLVQLPGAVPETDTAAIESAATNASVARATFAPARRATTVEPASQPQPTSWFYADGLPQPSRAHVVRVEVSPQFAARFGVMTARPLAADLLIGDDGLTRAIRFVR